MEFVKHKHPLILDENFPGGYQACYLCREPLHSPLIYSVYRCSSISDSFSIADNNVDCVELFLHKSCAELPLKITDYFMHPQHPISLVPIGSTNSSWSCSICLLHSSAIISYSCQSPTCSDLRVCLKCVTSPLVHHPSHNEHELTIVQRPASFRCFACDSKVKDLSSCKCNICPFWIHMSCALLPLQIVGKIYHRHPLVLAYCLPQLYSKFPQHCQICQHQMNPTKWLYSCGSCRFFVHLPCVDRSTRASGYPKKTIGNEPIDTSNFDALLKQPRIMDRIGSDSEYPMYLPVSDESILKFWQQQFIKRRGNQGTLYKEMIEHWSHRQHPLFLKNQHPLIVGNKSLTTNDMQLTTKNWRYIVYDDKIMLCDGCTYPIYPSISRYYECPQCKYHLHTYCSEIKDQKQYVEDNNILLSVDISSICLFNCRGCGFLRSGMALLYDDFLFDIGCASLPSYIKHEAHQHNLFQFWPQEYGKLCKACGISSENKFMYGDSEFTFYLHNTCALKPHKLEHRWDPHPLTLITKPENVSEDHPHDYNCEHCSIDLDTNYWFYHCSLCDLSCHIYCVDEFYKYSNIKFGESNFKTDQQLHEHGLTLVLSKRKRCCGCCGGQIYNEPILECRPCNFIICMPCVNRDHLIKTRIPCAPL